MKPTDKLAFWIIVFALLFGSVYYFTKIQKYESYKIKTIESKTSQQYRININLAEQEELENLPGIGPSLAAEIIRNRNQIGRFEEINDLLRVKGIGNKKYQAIEDYLSN